MNRFADTPSPPYYAVIFTSQRTEGDKGYEDMPVKMVELARTQRGFLGLESVRDAAGFGITVSYWSDLEGIQQWKSDVDHQLAQKLGRSTWYEQYQVRVSKVERAYSRA